MSTTKIHAFKTRALAIALLKQLKVAEADRTLYITYKEDTDRYIVDVEGVREDQAKAAGTEYVAPAGKTFGDKLAAEDAPVKPVKALRDSKRLLKIGVEGKIKVKKEKAVKEPKETKDTVANCIRECIAEGWDNAEIWAHIQPAYELSDDKLWYPGWYRKSFERKAAKLASHSVAAE